ncbi:MAG: hypothetical protein ACK6CU_09235 [Deltaproteobacteria bacterium]|jgi:hypothetical protein
MAYDRVDAREQTRNALAARLADVRVQLGSRRALKDEEARLVNELEALARDEQAAWEREARASVRLPDGAKLSIASPCREKWNAMVGDDRVRHCSRCDKDVYNLSGMTGPEITALLARRGERPCVRFFKRQDGTMLTADCPVGRPKKIALRVITAAGLAIGASASGLVAALAGPRPRCPVAQNEGRHGTMGEPMRIGPPSPRVRGNEPTSYVRPDYTELAGGVGAFEEPFEPEPLPHLPEVPELRSE